MALVVDRELGREDLEARRLDLIERSDEFVENYSLITEGDILNWSNFCSEVMEPKSLLNKKIWNHKRFSTNSKIAIKAVHDAGTPLPGPVDRVLGALNALLEEQDFCRAADAKGLGISEELHPLLDRRPQELSVREIVRRNRLFLEAASPDLFRKSQPPPAPVTRFFQDEVGRYLHAPFPSWRWLFSREALEPVSCNHYLRVRALAGKDQVDPLWQCVQKRRQMDLEYWFHRLARVWLLLHGPAAAGLLVLVLVHVWYSIYYGGFF
jgi:hypothetical protein